MSGRCRICHRNWNFSPQEQPCEECLRLIAYGVLVDACLAHWNLTALEALSRLMGTTTRLRREHRKEMFAEQREAQRGARDAYSEGVDVGRHERSDW
jgi:hypothetical protein